MLLCAFVVCVVRERVWLDCVLCLMITLVCGCGGLVALVVAFAVGFFVS